MGGEEARHVVTAAQARALLNADSTPRTAKALLGLTIWQAQRRIGSLVRAGFLHHHQQGRHSAYTITPAGREFAAYLVRLNDAY